jgi:hypothetical protein
MAYTPDTLSMINQTIGGTVPRVFVYLSTDADGTIVGASYFSDGVTKGMRVGDIVDAVNATGPKYKRYQVASVSGAAATVAAPTAIT